MLVKSGDGVWRERRAESLPDDWCVWCERAHVGHRETRWKGRSQACQSERDFVRQVDAAYKRLFPVVGRRGWRARQAPKA